MSNSWKTIKELRETSIDISGGYYSEKYVDKYNLSEKWRAKCYAENSSMWVPEAVEVTIDSNLEILYRIKHVGSRNKKQKEKFKTSLGTFILNNQGEFGGELITPKETLHGNFEAVFECDGFVYAIDSCDHMCMGHIKIYTFSKNIDAIKLYESIDFLKDETIYESLSLEGLYVEEDRVYILSAGCIEQNYLGENKTYEEKSYLYEIKMEQL